ncbi:hypothetical protein E6C27_scaffold48834G00080 [Cucumis melo var. makuwa]|uniref:Uncharacterized protein n=1 Tax=Cucumis melo var. makuwa TaxID=1194695 RepID=A0A5A7U0L4_CUCMM|nr:hypothetical protein E6C27_scaffold48834G00080 [Cucumis melo var. makuwa]
MRWGVWLGKIMEMYRTANPGMRLRPVLRREAKGISLRKSDEYGYKSVLRTGQDEARSGTTE